MRDYLRLLRLLLPYRGRLALLALWILLASVLSTVGVTFVQPLLRILMVEESTSPAGGELDAAPEDVDAAPEDVGAAAEDVGAAAGDVGPAAEDLGAANADPGLTGVRAADRDAEDQAPDSLPLPSRLRSAQERVRRALVGFLEAHLYVGTRMEQLLRFCAWLFGLYLAKNLFGFLQEVFRVDLEHRTIFDIREQLYQAVHALPLGFFSRERTGYLMSRIIADVDMMRGAIVGSLTLILSNSIMVVLALFIVVNMSWKLSLATFLIVPPNMLLVGFISKKLRRGSHRVQEEMGDVASILQETISGIRIVKAFGREGAEADRFRSSNFRYYRAYVKLKTLEALSSPVSEVLGILTLVLILAVGGNLVLGGELSPDELILFVVLMLWVIAPIKSLIKVNSTLQQSLAAVRRVFQILDTPREALDGTGRRDARGLFEALRFRGVSFEYQADVPVLRDIELEVQAGEVVALVGPSGAGKSTLVDLVPRFYVPTRGSITLDGVDVADIHLPTLRSLVGMVTQEVILFHDTVEANLRYGRPEATRAEVEAAARVANAHEFIAELPRGYDTVIGERGTRLSGGQRQRLAIARAVLKDPPILILDEATSALDTESEKAVQEAMERLMEGRTTLVIAHRLSTITRADRIVVMEGGRIVESGTHAALLDGDGVYRRLYELQFQLDVDDPGRRS